MVSFLVKMNIQPDTTAVPCSSEKRAQLRRMWTATDKTALGWSRKNRLGWWRYVYSAKAKKFYSDKEIYKKNCLEMKCSAEDMLLFACNPIYPSNISESAIHKIYAIPFCLPRSSKNWTSWIPPSKHASHCHFQSMNRLVFCKPWLTSWNRMLPQTRPPWIGLDICTMKARESKKIQRKPKNGTKKQQKPGLLQPSSILDCCILKGLAPPKARTKLRSGF